jgi:putative membrane protein
MKFRNGAMALSLTTLLAALLGGCDREDRTGQPETETTGSVQSEQQTGSASATTTGVAGGTRSEMTNEDKEFVTMAGLGGLAEVQMANLALQKATNADVKAFAQRMSTDHSKSNGEIAEFATAKGLALATELSGDPKSALEHLTSLSGAAFDKAYMQHMVEDHEKAVAAFDKASTSATDMDLKAWAGRTLPTLKEHLELAKQTARKV